MPLWLMNNNMRPGDPNTGRIHKCDVCGSRGRWCDGWEWFGSWLDDDAGIVFNKCPSCEISNADALEANGGPVALFASRKAARNAINISKANTKLTKLQGGPVNEEFGEAVRCVKIIEARVWAESEK